MKFALLVVIVIIIAVLACKAERCEDPVWDGAGIRSPAPGLVSDISESGGRTKIGIFLRLCDDHTQYFPVSGRVLSVTYSGAHNYPAFNANTAASNVSAETVIVTNSGEIIKITQIAGIIARRVIAYKKPGDIVARGDKLGYIPLGSRVTIEFNSRDNTIKTGKIICSGDILSF